MFDVFTKAFKESEGRQQALLARGDWHRSEHEPPPDGGQGGEGQRPRRPGL